MNGGVARRRSPPSASPSRGCRAWRTRTRPTRCSWGAALDEGLSPRDLLAGLGTLTAVAPLLKARPDQPRVPAGNGRVSGEYGSTGGTMATAPANSSKRPGQGVKPATPPASSGTGEATVIPVFLDTRREQATKPPSASAPNAPSFAIPAVRPFDGFLPLGGSPAPAPNGGTFVDQDDEDGPACPPQRRARPNGPDPVADQREFDLARIINPGDPTPKQAPTNPSAQSMAYSLPLASRASGEVEHDDRRRTAAPNAILGMRKGDLAEIKGGEATFLYDVPKSSGYLSFENQIKAQNNAVSLERKGRSIFYCMDNARVAALAARGFGMDNPASHFTVCHCGSKRVAINTCMDVNTYRVRSMWQARVEAPAAIAAGYKTFLALSQPALPPARRWYTQEEPGGPVDIDLTRDPAGIDRLLAKVHDRDSDGQVWVGS